MQYIWNVFLWLIIKYFQILQAACRGFSLTVHATLHICRGWHCAGSSKWPRCSQRIQPAQAHGQNCAFWSVVPSHLLQFWTCNRAKHCLQYPVKTTNHSMAVKGAWSLGYFTVSSKYNWSRKSSNRKAEDALRFDAQRAIFACQASRGTSSMEATLPLQTSALYPSQ